MINRIHFWYMSKDDAINIIKNFSLNKKMDRYIFIINKNEWNLLSKGYRNDTK